MIPGALLAIWVISSWRGANPLLLLDGLALFGLVRVGGLRGGRDSEGLPR